MMPRVDEEASEVVSLDTTAAAPLTTNDLTLQKRPHSATNDTRVEPSEPNLVRGEDEEPQPEGHQRRRKRQSPNDSTTDSNSHMNGTVSTASADANSHTISNASITPSARDDSGPTVAAGVDPSSSFASPTSRRPPLAPSQAPAILQSEQQQQSQLQPPPAHSSSFASPSNRRQLSPAAASLTSAFVPVGNSNNVNATGSTQPQPGTTQMIKPVPSHPQPPPAQVMAQSVAPYRASPPHEAAMPFVSSPPAVPPSPSHGLSPFNNPHLNFSWPVFSPSPPVAQVPAIQETPAIMLTPSAQPYHAPGGPGGASSVPSSHHQSPHLQQQHHQHHLSTQSSSPYLSPPPVQQQPHHGYSASTPAAPLTMAAPPVIPHLTPEQQAFLNAGWQQAQLYASQQQQQQQYGALPPPSQQQMASASYSPYQSSPQPGAPQSHPYYSPSPPAVNSRLDYSHSQPNSSAPPLGRNWSTTTVSPSSGTLPTATYTAPSFTPISPMISSSSAKDNLGVAKAAPPGLMVLTPRLPPPMKTGSSSDDEDSSSSSSSESSSDDDHHRKHKKKKKKSHRSSHSKNSSSSARSNLLPPPHLGERSITDPLVVGRSGSDGGSLKPSSSLMMTPPSAMASSANTSPLLLPGQTKKAPWKVQSAKQLERARLKQEIVARERENLKSNKHLERRTEEDVTSLEGGGMALTNLQAAFISSSSSTSITPPSAELKHRLTPSRRTPNGSTSSSSSSNHNRTSSRRGSNSGVSPGNTPQKLPRSAVVGALVNPNSDLEVSIFLTLMLVAVAIFSLVIFLR